MAFALAQSNHTKGTLATATPTGTYSGLAFPSNVTAGSLLILAVCYDQGATVTGITGGGTWAIIGSRQNDSTNGQNAEIWYCANATGGATTPVIAYNSASTGFGGASLVIAEFTGVLAASPLDTSNTAKAFATSSTSTDGNTSNNITPAASGELIIGCYQGTAGVAPTLTAGTGFAIGPNEPGTAGATGATALEYKTGASGAQGSPFTSNKSTDRYTVQIAAFKAGGTTYTKAGFGKEGV